MNDGVSVRRTSATHVEVTYDRGGVLWTMPLRVRPDHARDLQDARNALAARHQDEQRTLHPDDADRDPISWIAVLQSANGAVEREPGDEADDGWLQEAADVTEQRIDMIWRPFVPAGFLTLIAGQPGAGKSLAMTSITARMTRGDPLPGEPAHVEHDPARVAWLSLEEHAGAIVRPRLRAADADLSRVLVIRDESEHCRLDSPVFLARLRDLIGRVRLIVIDSLAAWSYADLNKGEAVREVLMPLARAVEATPCAIALIAHYRKAAAGTALDRVAGSAQAGASVRSVVTVSKKREGGRVRHYWAHAKANLSEPGVTQTFDTRGAMLEIDGAETSIGLAVWGDAAPDMSADDLAAVDAQPSSGEDSRADEDDAQALLDAMRAAGAAGLKPEWRSGGAVSAKWVDLVAEDVERPSGRPKRAQWAASVLRAIGIDVARDGRKAEKRRFPGLSATRFYYTKGWEADG